MTGAGASDVVVIGGGAFGLWTALACLRRGMRVTVADRAEVGGPQAASATPVGALAPYGPERWTEAKAFQLRALAGLPEAMARLVAESGVSVGFARTGRAVPLPDAAARARAEAQVAAASAWDASGRMWIEDGGDWVAPGGGGVLRDDLTARVDPPRLLAALRAACLASGAVLREGWAFRGWDGAEAAFDRGRIGARVCVLAAGAECFELVPGLAGGPVHGRAARLRLRAPEGAPVIGAPGLWVVPHADGTVAVGSTSDPGRGEGTDPAALDAVIDRARGLCPALASSPVLARWEGLRPRAASRRPVLGAVPGRPGLILATGGMGVGLALAPLLGEAAAALAAGEDPALPAGFAPEVAGGSDPVANPLPSGRARP